MCGPGTLNTLPHAEEALPMMVSSGENGGNTRYIVAVWWLRMPLTSLGAGAIYEYKCLIYIYIHIHVHMYISIYSSGYLSQKTLGFRGCGSHWRHSRSVAGGRLLPWPQAEKRSLEACRRGGRPVVGPLGHWATGTLGRPVAMAKELMIQWGVKEPYHYNHWLDLVLWRLRNPFAPGHCDTLYSLRTLKCKGKNHRNILKFPQMTVHLQSTPTTKSEVPDFHAYPQ